MHISDDVPRAAEIALDAMGNRPWTDLTPAVTALRKQGFDVQSGADLQPLVDALQAQGTFKPLVKHPGISWHPDAYTVIVCRA